MNLFFCVLFHAFHESGAVGLLGDRYLHRVGRQDILDEFWPFHKADRAGFYIVLEADVIDLFLFLDSVEVEVIDRLALPVGVFVYDGEGRGGDDVLHAKFLAYCLDECCLACAHVAVEGKDGVVAHCCHELLGCG